MSSYKYKNTTDHDLQVIGFGFVEAGGEFESAEPIESPNLELINAPQAQPEQPQPQVQAAPAPAATVAPVAPVQVAKTEETN